MGSDGETDVPDEPSADAANEPAVETADEETEELGVPAWPAFGTLRFDVEQGLRLETIAPIDPFAPDPVEGMTLNGQLLDGHRCSLLDVSPRGIDGPVGNYGIHRYRGFALVHNAHVSGIDDLDFSSCRLEFDGLREFMFPPDIGRFGLEDSGDLMQKVVELPSARLTFQLSWRGRESIHSEVKERHAQVFLELTEDTGYTAVVERWVRPLRNLIVFATQEPSRLRSCVATTLDEAPPDFLRVRDPEAFRRRDVEFIRPEGTLRLTEARYGFLRMLFAIWELGERADELLERWFEMHQRLAGSADFLFAALTSRMYLENMLLNVTSAAEAYHRTFHDEPPLDEARHNAITNAMLGQTAGAEEWETYKNPVKHANAQSQRRRLRWLWERAGAVVPELAEIRRAAVHQLVETRNHFVHLDARSTDVREGLELAILLEQLVVVLNTNFLLDLGLKVEEVERAIRRAYEATKLLNTKPT